MSRTRSRRARAKRSCSSRGRTGASAGRSADKSGTSRNSFALVSCRDLALGREAVARSPADDGRVGGELLPLPLDIYDHESIGKAIDWVENEYGRIDVLINNAAVCFNSPTLYGRVEHTTFEEQAT